VAANGSGCRALVFCCTRRIRLPASRLDQTPFARRVGSTRVRHVALLPRGDRLHVLFTAIGDAPERLLWSTIDMAIEWRQWRVSTAVEVMEPETAYECASQPIAPSLVGDVAGEVRQIRDPYILEDEGKTYVYYAICGEQGIAGAELVLP